MGWRIADRLELLFLDSEGAPIDLFDGCVVVATAVTVDEYAAVTSLIGRELLATEEHHDRLVEVADRVAASIEEWNLEEKDGSPTPITGAGLRGHPKAVTFGVINAWVEAQRAGPRPFAKPSTDGAPLAEIPATPLAS